MKWVNHVLLSLILGLVLIGVFTGCQSEKTDAATELNNSEKVEEAPSAENVSEPQQTESSSEEDSQAKNANKED